MPTAKGFRLAGKFLKAVPFAGDIAGGIGEMYNPAEADAYQRALNAILVGGGGALASAATWGFDFIPAIVGAVADTPLENVNPETILRRLSYMVGQGRDPGKTTGEQLRNIQEWSKGKPRQPGPDYGSVPLKF